MGSIKNLIEAEKKAVELFRRAEREGLIIAGKTERDLNKEMYELAAEMFGIRKYWHKRIVRSGRNTLLPYRENPPVLELQDKDILFFDFGPVFDEWEADIGRTYVIGDDPDMIRLANDVESAWHEGKDHYRKNEDSITGAEFYDYTCDMAKRYGWSYGNEHCGHLIGNFPHEKLQGEELSNYIHPDNTAPMSRPDKNGNRRFWIYEIHFIDQEKQIGGFFEQLVSSRQVL